MMPMRFGVAAVLASACVQAACATVYSVSLEGDNRVIGREAQVTLLRGDSVEIAIPVIASGSVLGCLTSTGPGAQSVTPSAPQQTPRGRSVLLLRTTTEELSSLGDRIYLAAPAAYFLERNLREACAAPLGGPGAYGHVIVLDSAQQGQALGVGLAAIAIAIAIGAGIPW